MLTTMQSTNHVVVMYLVAVVAAPVLASPALIGAARRPESKVTYYKASIPQRIFNCVHSLNSLTRCMKLLLLARLEARMTHFKNTGNITTDFFDQIVSDEDDTGIPYNFYEVYAGSNDTEVNDRLLKVFQRFFEGREITLHFVPGMIVKVVPNSKNQIDFALKQDTSVNEARGGGGEIGLLGGGGGGGKKKKGYGYYAQFAVPLFIFPAILFGTFLPFLIPALKMATMFAGMVNNAALLASIMYLARQIAIENEQKQTVYFNPGYNR